MLHYVHQLRLSGLSGIEQVYLQTRLLNKELKLTVNLSRAANSDDISATPFTLWFDTLLQHNCWLYLDFKQVKLTARVCIECLKEATDYCLNTSDLPE